MRNVLLTAIAASIPFVRAHISFYHPSMWGYNVRAEDYPYDNRPETPLQQYTFQQWWFHNHLAHPPPDNTFFELPAGGTAISQLACNKGATEWWRDSPGTTDIRQGDYPCPNSPTSEFHGHDDLKGCALSIAYTSDINNLKPEDLTIFSVNHECVWKVSTPFQVPKDMPACPDGGCICAWHWIHSVDSGSAQMYMNGFRCKVTGATSNTPVMTPVVPKRCTGDITKCNQGAQQPLYWFQAERNNMFNGQYDPPYYLDEWGFTDGPQNGIFGKRSDIVNINAPSSVPPSSTSPSSTPPAGSQPSPSPVDSKPSSTPADNKPPSTPAQNNPASTPQTLPKDPSNGGNGGGSPENSPPSYPPPPKPSKKPRCKDKKNKKRQEVVSHHFKRKRHHARDHHH